MQRHWHDIGPRVYVSSVSSSVAMQRHCHEIRKQEAKVDTVKVGDVVHVHSKDDPRIKWKLGLITDVHRSSDGLVRSASVKTKSGVSRRAIYKLYPLEINAGDIEYLTQKPNDTQKDPVKILRPARKAAEMAKSRISAQMREEAASLIASVLSVDL